MPKESRFDSPRVARDFCFLQSIQSSCGAHLACYPMGTVGVIPERKASRTWSWAHVDRLTWLRMRGALPTVPHTPPWRGAEGETHFHIFRTCSNSWRVSITIQEILKSRGVQIPGDRSSWRVNCVGWRLLFVAPQQDLGWCHLSGT
jgi:hypothetical protein